MDFSIIIPTYNEAEHIRRCIESVKANGNNNIEFEIIVVDNGSTDGTVEIVKDAGVRIIENNEGINTNISTRRNIGAKSSRGNVFVFLDADMAVPTNWLKRASAYFCDGFEGAIGFVNNVPSSSGWVGRTWGNRLSLKRDKTMNVDFLPGSNIFVNRHVFKTLNGFNSALETAEDKDLTFRVLQAGFRVVSVPDIGVTHFGYEKNLWEFLRKEFWRQGSTLKLTKQCGFSFRSLRNPLLSFWHIFFLFTIILSTMFLSLPFTLLLILLWICPSILIAFSSVRSKYFFNTFLPLFFLTFLQWHVSGLALLNQFIKMVPRRRGG